MFKKFVPLCFAVAAAFVFANVASADDAVVPVTAPVAVTVDSCCDCGHKKVARKQIRVHRLRCNECVVPCEVAPVEVCCTPLVPVCAYRKALCGYRPTTVWVEEGTEEAYASADNKCGSRCCCADFEPFDAYKKILCGFRPVTAYKKVGVCGEGCAE